MGWIVEGRNSNNISLKLEVKGLKRDRKSHVAAST